MSKSSRRKRREKSRKRRDRKSTASLADPAARAGLSRPLRLAVENIERFGSLAAGFESPSDALGQIEARIAEAAREIVRIAAGHDAFEILEYIRWRELVHNPETYRETEHEGSGLVVEVAALCLSCRADRQSPSEPPGDELGSPRVDEIRALAVEISELGSLVAVLDALVGSAAGGLTSLSLKAASRRVHVRNLSYPHMAVETINGLYGTEEIDRWCRGALGFAPSEAVAVLDSLGELGMSDWSSRFDVLVDAFDGVDLDSEPSEETKETLRAALEHVFGNVGSVSVFADEEVASSVGVAVEVVAAVRDALSTDISERDAGKAAVEFFRGENPFAAGPLLRASDGSSVLVHSGFNTSAVRRHTEAQLKSDPSIWDKYSKDRGRYLEDQAVDLVRGVFPDAVVHSGIEYLVPNDSAATLEVTPEKYTKLTEGDGLILIDDVAIVVEAKAKPLSPAADRGVPGRLLTELRKIVTDASEQAERMRTRIEQDRGLKLKDGSWLDLSSVVEVHTVTVALDDLSSIATLTTDLVSAGLLSSDRLPWTVSLHDLRVIAEVVDRPAEMLLYLRRRTDPACTVIFSAVDELDFFMEFLGGGFYIEPDPEARQRELPHLGEVPVRDRRRYREQPRQFLTSRTDQLDHWYAYQLGERATPAEKPSRSDVAGVVELVDHLQELGEPGWLAAGTALIDGNIRTQREFARFSADLVRKTRHDGKHHSLAVPVGSTLADSHLLVWITRGPHESLESAFTDMAGYVSAKKHQFQLARGTGFLLDRQGLPVRTAHDNSVPRPGADLDEAHRTSRLRSVKDIDSPGRIRHWLSNSD